MAVAAVKETVSGLHATLGRLLDRPAIGHAMRTQLTPHSPVVGGGRLSERPFQRGHALRRHFNKEQRLAHQLPKADDKCP